MRRIFFIALVLFGLKALALDVGQYQACLNSVEPNSHAKRPLTDSGWSTLLLGKVKQLRNNCNPDSTNFSNCLSEFLDRVRPCENIGSEALKTYVGQVETSAQAWVDHHPGQSTAPASPQGFGK